MTLGQGMVSQTQHQKHKQQKEKQIHQTGPHQNEKLCTSKDTIKRMRRQPTKIKKTFANHVSGKTLISRMYKEASQLNNKKTTQFQKQGLKRDLSQDIQMANKHMIWCSTALDIGETQIKTTVRGHSTPAGKALIKKGKQQVLV